MAYRALEVTLISARNLKRVNLMTPMEVYAVVSVSGNPMARQCTLPDRYGGRNPTWNATLHLAVPVAAAAASFIHVLLRTERALGDRDVGEVFVPVADLLAAGDCGRVSSYLVQMVGSSVAHGVLTLSYRIDAVVAPPAADAVPAYLVVPCYANAPPYVYMSRAAAANAAFPAAARKRNGGEFGEWLGGAVRGMFGGGGEMVPAASDAAAYDAGYKAGVADHRRVKF
uniref:C2 domain-containing protein n=1 Tax=Leersia perrieri TaxID=77586 RepID=A0A0D9X2R5_9ORYZ